MRPREIVAMWLEEIVVPALAHYGFTYAPSKMHFRRKAGYATQEIGVSLNQRNTTEWIHFWTGWGVSSQAYTRWYKEQWGVKPVNNSLGGSADWNIPGWTYPGPSYRQFDFSVPSRRRDVMQALVENAERYGIPFLDGISTWEGAAERLLSDKWFFSKACDFYLIADQPEKARHALEAGLHAFEVEGRSDQTGEVPEIKKRLRKYFGVSEEK